MQKLLLNLSPACPHPSSAIPGQNGSAFSKRITASRCLSAGESIKTVWFIDIMEYYSAIRKKEVLPYGTAWMDLEGMMLSGMSQTEKDQYHTVSPVESENIESTEPECRLPVTRSPGWGKRDELVKGHEPLLSDG